MSEERARDGASQPGELEELMERYQRGEEEAATELIGKLSAQIFQFYLAEARERPRAEDLLQDFWLRIHSARRTYRPGEPVLPWIYAIARRVRIDEYRRNRSRRYEMQSEQLPEMAAGRSRSDESLNLSRSVSNAAGSATRSDRVVEGLGTQFRGSGARDRDERGGG